MHAHELPILVPGWGELGMSSLAQIKLIPMCQALEGVFIFLF
jgi:hypothetical protein